MDERESNHQNQYRRHLEEKIRKLNQDAKELKSDKLSSFIDTERNISRFIQILALFLIVSHPTFINIAGWGRIYPIFSVVVLISIFTLVVLSIANLINARGVLDDG